MYVLGVHIGHDSSAALIFDGEVVADVAEERLTRVKHFAGFPGHAIQACLDLAGITIREVDVVAVPTSTGREELNYFFELKGTRRERETVRRRMAKTVRRLAGKGWEKPPLYVKTFPLSPATELVHVDHHLAHAASAYYTCGSASKQLIITMDGVGDNDTSIGVWRGESGKITLLKRFDTRGSIGWFYGNVTEALGWRHGDGEGKTMGLAPYGDAERARGVLDRFCPKFQGGDLVEPHDFGLPYFWNQDGAYHWHFDEADEIQRLVHEHGREHVAAEAQRLLEEQVPEIVFPWMEREKTADLCCSGGVFLNVKLNQRLWESGKIANQHIFPNPGDAGLAAGGALYAYNQRNGSTAPRPLKHIFWGPSYSNQEIRAILEERNLSYGFEEDVASVAAEYLAQNRIVGWFQGRMESGPRALGRRSILMSPTAEENKDIINARVKFREAFRPFCPSILAEHGGEYFRRHRPERFMITSFDAMPDKRSMIPAVVHVDGTLRPQTVEREVNPLYWRLIERFGELTGQHALLNTSFNIKNEPIVCHPRDAIRCFYDTGLDCLILENYVLTKT
jgi:carbamoyltransferase